MFRQLMSMVTSSGEAPSPPEPLPPLPAEAPPLTPPAPSSATTVASTAARIKHKRESQDDVAHFSTWPDLGLALMYAEEELVPREKESGAAWRILKREDGREDKVRVETQTCAIECRPAAHLDFTSPPSQSRDKQWRCYRSVAIAVGSLMHDGTPYEEAVSAIQGRFESFGAKPHSPFLAVRRSSRDQAD
eukprot:1353967-Prymnesium_polylepis.1